MLHFTYFFYVISSDNRFYQILYVILHFKNDENDISIYMYI